MDSLVYLAFSLGGTELLIILVVLVLFFGVRKLPAIGRGLGESMRELRGGGREEDSEGDDELPNEEGADASEGEGSDEPKAERPQRSEIEGVIVDRVIRRIPVVGRLGAAARKAKAAKKLIDP